MPRGQLLGELDQQLFVDAEMSNIILAPWHRLVSIKGAFVEYDELRQRTFPMRGSVGGRISGFYASYIDGFFAVFEDRDGDIKILLNGIVISKSEISKASVTSGIFGRKLSLNLKTGEQKFFIYQSPKTIFRHPIKFINSVLLADDDWGLVCDLPGYLSSVIEKGRIDLLINLINKSRSEG